MTKTSINEHSFKHDPMWKTGDTGVMSTRIDGIRTMLYYCLYCDELMLPVTGERGKKFTFHIQCEHLCCSYMVGQSIMDPFTPALQVWEDYINLFGSFITSLKPLDGMV